MARKRAARLFDDLSESDRLGSSHPLPILSPVDNLSNVDHHERNHSVVLPHNERECIRRLLGIGTTTTICDESKPPPPLASLLSRARIHATTNQIESDEEKSSQSLLVHARAIADAEAHIPFVSLENTADMRSTSHGFSLIRRRRKVATNTDRGVGR